MAEEIILYHCVGARSFRPLWMLEELERPYRLVTLPFPPRAHRKDYFDINVLGTVPAMIVAGHVMTESAAACEYLAAVEPGSALHVDPADPVFPDYLNWLHHGEATLTFPQTLVLRYGRFEPPEKRRPEVADAYAQWFVARTRLLLAALESREHLCGRFTAADVSVGYALMLAEQIGLLEMTAPSIQAYWSRLKARPALARAVAAERAQALAQGVSAIPAAQSSPG